MPAVYTFCSTLKKAGISAAPVLASIGRERVILKEIRHPPVPTKEEPALVRFQTAKELSESPDDVIIDYTPLSDPAAPGGRMIVDSIAPFLSGSATRAASAAEL